MKRVLLGADGATIDNVNILPDDADACLPSGLDIPDEVYAGVGLVWNGDVNLPRFEAAK